MGLWNKLRNLVRGRGWHEDEELIPKPPKKPLEQEAPPLKQEPIKKQEKIEKQLPTIREESQIEEKQNNKPKPLTKQEIEREQDLQRRELEVQRREKAVQQYAKETQKIAEETIEEAKQLATLPPEDLTPKGREITTQYFDDKTKDTTLTTEEKKQRKKLTELETQQEINKALETQKIQNWAQLGTITNASDYWNQMRQAVINGMRGTKDATIIQVANSIIAQPEIFRNRFDSLANITTEDGNTFQITAIGTLPHDFRQVMDEEGIKPGDTTTTTDLNKITTRLNTKLGGKTIGGTKLQNTAYMQSTKTYTITNIEYQVKFG